MNFKFKSIIKNIFNNLIFKPFGIMLMKSDRDFSVLSALKNMRSRGYLPATIIDIGASNGKWSNMTYEVFPESHYLLLEPLDENHVEIHNLIKKHKNWKLSKKVAGNETSRIQFNVKNDIDGSSVLFDGQDAVNIRSFEMTTVDSEVEHHKLPPPYLVKLDTHGFEVPVLDGMNKIWDKIDFLIIESYNFKLHPECLRFFELVAFLEERGFSPIDIVDLRRRPGDQILWQMDIVFGKNNQKEFNSKKYKGTDG